MTKEEYEKIRNLPEIPMPIWFEYYKERGGTADFTDFEHVFSTALWNESIVSTMTGMKQITLKTALDNFYAYYNTKFNL